MLASKQSALRGSPLPRCPPGAREPTRNIEDKQTPSAAYGWRLLIAICSGRAFLLALPYWGRYIERARIYAKSIRCDPANLRGLIRSFFWCQGNIEDFLIPLSLGNDIQMRQFPTNIADTKIVLSITSRSITGRLYRNERLKNAMDT